VVAKVREFGLTRAERRTKHPVRHLRKHPNAKKRLSEIVGLDLGDRLRARRQFGSVPHPAGDRPSHPFWSHL